MRRIKIPSIILTPATIILVLGISVAIIAYGKGYRFDINNKSVAPTGLITATSDPVGATIFINGKKETATNANINVEPDWYTVTIVKEGYQPWEKRIRVQGEVVARADAMLFPNNPSLYAITTNGAKNPKLSPDGTKLAYIVPTTLASTTSGQLVNRTGIWVLDTTDKPLGLNRDARRIVDGEMYAVDNATLAWSPDSKTIVFSLPTETLYSVDVDKGNDSIKQVTSLDVLKTEWNDLSVAKEKEKLAGLVKPLQEAIQKSMKILAFSPDENKILYEATASAILPEIITPPLIGSNATEETRSLNPNSVYVYDVKEDKNFLIGDTSILTNINTPTTPCTPTATKVCPPTTEAPNLQWLASSLHLIITKKDRIDIMEYDGQNVRTVYVGPFMDGFVAPWSTGNKLIILTNLNAAASTMPNLYAVNIR